MTKLTEKQKEALQAINMWGDRAFKHLNVAEATTRSLQKRGLIAIDWQSVRTTEAGAALAAGLGTP